MFALEEGGVQERAIGLLFLLNSLLIVGAQLPIARSLEGRSRMRAFAVMGVCFALCWVLVVVGGATGTAETAFALFALAFASLSLGECIYDSVQGPLTAALAPEAATARYMAANGFSWQLGFIVGPALGAVVLARAPYLLWSAAAVAALAAGAYALALERHLPAAERTTPRRR